MAQHHRPTRCDNQPMFLGLMLKMVGLQRNFWVVVGQGSFKLWANYNDWAWPQIILEDMNKTVHFKFSFFGSNPACHSMVRNLDEWVLSTNADRAIRIELKISDFVDAWHAPFRASDSGESLDTSRFNEILIVWVWGNWGISGQSSSWCRSQDVATSPVASRTPIPKMACTWVASRPFPAHRLHQKGPSILGSNYAELSSSVAGKTRWRRWNHVSGNRRPRLDCGMFGSMACFDWAQQIYKAVPRCRSFRLNPFIVVS